MKSLTPHYFYLKLFQNLESFFADVYIHEQRL